MSLQLRTHISTLEVLMRPNHRTLIHLAVPTLVAMLLPSAVSAQIPQPSDTTSVPIAGAGHDYLGGQADTVNPANGSFSVRIPVIMPPSRGVTLPFSFMYDSTLYYLSGNRGQNAQWFKVKSSALPAEGWGFAEPIVSATEASWRDTVHGIICHYTFGYVFQDAAGRRHNLNLTNYYQDSHAYCLN